MTTAPRSVVVVGASIAGTSAADTLRAEGFDGSITLVGDEPHTAYARPSLSKAMLQGHETPESILLPAQGSDVEVLTATRAVSLDLDARLLTVERDGERSTLPFDGIVLATGARARSLAAPEQRGEFVVRCLDDSLALAAALAGARRVAVLGGGFLGMELASSVRAMGLDVTVVDVAPPLLRQLGPTLSDLVVSAARDHGVQLETAPGGAALDGRSEITGIRVADGRVFAADVVISAVGDLPNVEWLTGSGLSSAGPLPTGPGGQVAPGVVAAGDMTGSADALTGLLTRTPHWHAAIGQGRIAARTLLRGAPQSATPDIPYFWTEGFGLEVKITGTIPAGVEPTVLEGSLADRNALLQWAGPAGPVAAASINHRMPLVKLKRLAASQPVRTPEVSQ